MRRLRIDKSTVLYPPLVMSGLGLRIDEGVLHIGIMRGGRVKNSVVRVSSAAEPEGCTGLVRARYREGP
jgi:hypothetical protein